MELDFSKPLCLVIKSSQQELGFAKCYALWSNIRSIFKVKIWTTSLKCQPQPALAAEAQAQC